MFELSLRVVPEEWRASVCRDLSEEAADAGRPRGSFWLAGHAFMVGLQFRWRWLTQEGTMEWWKSGGVGADVRMAYRSIRRHPRPALAVVATLALGIGGVTATYAVFNHVVFRPMPGVVDPDGLVSLHYWEDPSTPNRTAASFAHLEAMRDGSDALEGLAAWSPQTAGFSADAGTAPLETPVTAVTRGYFQLLGVRWRSGRAFSDEEYAGGQAVLVVSEVFARDRLGGEGASVGRTVYLNGRLHEVIGVVDDFRGVDRMRHDDVWLPHRTSLAVGERPGVEEVRTVFQMVGRLRPGVTLEQAQIQVRTASREAGPVSVASRTFEPVLFAGLTDGIGSREARLERLYRTLLAGVTMLLLLACANAANLMLARNVRRRHDLAMRAALGAGRGRLVRELTIESAGLAMGGCVLGLVVAAALTHLFRGTRLLAYLPVLEEVALDVRVVAFCAGAAGLTLLLFGVVPALLGSRTELHGGLREWGTVVPRTGRLRTFLVTTQFALSTTLLVGAGLLARTAWHLQSLDLGLDPEGVVSIEIRPYRVRPDGDRTAAILRETRERLAAVQGFEAVAVAWDGPFGNHYLIPIGGPSGLDDAPTNEILHYVTDEYFDVLRIPLLAGRSFGDVDVQAASAAVRPVVINEAFALKWFGTANAVGRSFTTPERGRDITLEVVGIAGNTRTRALREGFLPAVYHPAAGHLRRATLLVRTNVGARRVREVARGVLHQVDPLVPLGAVATLDDEIAAVLAEERLMARLGSVVAALATLLAIAGLYAVIAFFVNERGREFAIRMALGARNSSVVLRVLRRVTALAAGGIGLGIAFALLSSRLLTGRLYGVDPWDPVIIGAAAMVLATAALLAAALPARRATKIDPMVALRVE